MTLVPHEVSAERHALRLAVLKKLQTENGATDTSEINRQAFYREALIFLSVACDLYAVCEVGVPASHDYADEALAILNRTLNEFVYSKREQQLHSN
jgi:hypothetical protein